MIIRADGHTILESDYVSKCVSTLFDHQVQNVGGRMDGVASTPFGEAVVRATSSRLGVGDSAFIIRPGLKKSIQFIWEPGLQSYLQK